MINIDFNNVQDEDKSEITSFKLIDPDKIIAFKLLKDFGESKAGQIAKKRAGGFIFDYTKLFFQLDTLITNPQYFEPIYKKDPFVFMLKGSTGKALLVFEKPNLYTYIFGNINILDLHLNGIRQFINNGFNIGIPTYTSAKRISIQGLGMVRRGELSKLIQQHDEHFQI